MPSDTNKRVLSAPSIVIPAKEEHHCTLIWLHGLGDCGLGWLFLVEELCYQLPTVKWILPTGPLQKAAFRARGLVPGWFSDIDPSAVDEEGILSSVELVDEIIQSEVEGGTKKIILGGVSQGCAIALLAGRITKTKLDGIIGVAGWLPRGEPIDHAVSDTNPSTPIMMCYDANKDMSAQSSGRYLEEIGHPVEFKAYPALGHTSADQMVSDIGAFMQRQIVHNTTD